MAKVQPSLSILTVVYLPLPRAPHVALHPTAQTQRLSLRSAVCILQIKAPWVSHSHRAFFLLAAAKASSNCLSSQKERLHLRVLAQVSFLQRLVLAPHPPGVPPLHPLCAPTSGAPIGQGAL